MFFFLLTLHHFCSPFWYLLSPLSPLGFGDNLFPFFFYFIINFYTFRLFFHLLSIPFLSCFSLSSSSFPTYLILLSFYLLFLQNWHRCFIHLLLSFFFSFSYSFYIRCFFLLTFFIFSSAFSFFRFLLLFALLFIFFSLLFLPIP